MNVSSKGLKRDVFWGHGLLGDEEPFCSHVFLTAGGEVFGLEYAEQLRLSADDVMEFLHVYRHWLVLRLPSQKRFWLRQLAKQLSTRLEAKA